MQMSRRRSSLFASSGPNRRSSLAEHAFAGAGNGGDQRKHQIVRLEPGKTFFLQIALRRDDDHFVRL
jgi:hypothetical protein